MLFWKNQYLKSSIDQVLNFFQNSDAISETVALETAAALQVYVDMMF